VSSDEEQNGRRIFKSEMMSGERQRRGEIKFERRLWGGKREVKYEGRVDESVMYVKNESTGARRESSEDENERGIIYIGKEANFKSEGIESDDDVILLE